MVRVHINQKLTTARMTNIFYLRVVCVVLYIFLHTSLPPIYFSAELAYFQFWKQQLVAGRRSDVGVTYLLREKKK